MRERGVPIRPYLAKPHSLPKKSNRLVGGMPAPTTIAPESFCRPVLLKIGRSKFSSPAAVMTIAGGEIVHDGRDEN